MSEVQDQVKKIVIDHLGIDESKVTPEAKFIDDLGADSLDTVELVMAFEEKFGIFAVPLGKFAPPTLGFYSIPILECRGA